MKALILHIVAFLFLFLSGSALAQNYTVVKCEKIHTPWDTGTTSLLNRPFTAEGNTRISLTLDKKIVMMSSMPPSYFLHFYIYDESSGSWLKKQPDSTFWKMYPYYTPGLQRVCGGEYESSDWNTLIGTKWVFNYGDSVWYDTAGVLTNRVFAVQTSPGIGYTATKYYSQERKLAVEGGQVVKPYSSNFYKRIYADGKVTHRNLLSFVGGNPGLPEDMQDYQNDIDFMAIDDETVVASIRTYYYYPAMNGQGAKYNTEKYTLLTTNSGITWTRSQYNLKLPEKNADGQWFIRQEPTTYLYYSERHGITPKQPVPFGFIDPHLKNVTITSEYANGTKGYYGLCNSKTDSTEKGKFLIYSISNRGTLQKFSIPDTIFEYPKPVSTDSSWTSVYGKQILYADDTVMYLQVTTMRGVERPTEKFDTVYYSPPQVYKVHLPNQTNGVDVPPQLTTLLLYPNPTDQILCWNVSEGTATITDALGAEVLAIPAWVMQADISGLAIGVYYLTIRSGGESVTRMFTVMR